MIFLLRRFDRMTGDFHHGDFWFNIGIEAVLGPISAMIGGLIAGVLSDHWPSRFGKRSAFIIYGAIIYGIGCIILVFDSFIPVFMLTNMVVPEPVWKDWTMIGIIFYAIGYVLWSIGNNVISVCYRA